MSDDNAIPAAEPRSDKYAHVCSPVTPRLGNRFTRWLGRATLAMMGWKIKGGFPNEPKLVFIGAPHTSNWDFILAMAAMQAAGVKASWMMKKEAFFWPLGGLFKKMGGVPIDRKAKMDLTTQMANWFNSVEQGYLGITPEGTRSKVEKFKKGYLRIAYGAGVPVFLVGLNGPTKEVVLDKIMPLTFDTEVDNRKIKAYYDKNYTGIKAENG
jgi:1-acyl-sn-glycerol-3-phosphate acyltransferase